MGLYNHYRKALYHVQYVLVSIEIITFTLFKMFLKVWFFLAVNTIAAFGELMLGCRVVFLTRDLRYAIRLVARYDGYIISYIQQLI